MAGEAGDTGAPGLLLSEGAMQSLLPGERIECCSRHSPIIWA
jgi:hypothetical protein